MTWQQIAESKRLLKRERGTVHKDWGGRLPIALVFPNTYYLGMSSLALHTLYRLWNAREDVVCERVFTGSRATKRQSPRPREWDLRSFVSPLSLETGAPLDFFPIIAFSISYELDYFSVVALLRAAGIPPRAADRDKADSEGWRQPLIIAGGAALSANPEPLAPILDAIVIGEVEPVFDSLTNALHLTSDDRSAALEALSQIPGLYLPHLQPPVSNRQHPTSNVQPVRRQRLHDLDAYPTHSVLLTPDTEFADMGLIEIARGCGRGCRFCLAGHIYRPPRQRSIESILAQAHELLRYGDRIGLVSAAVSDHAQIDQLAAELRGLGARLSVSSMRVDPISEPLIRALSESGARTLTIAPEAGSERLRQLIHKTQTESDVLRAVDLAARSGLRQIKLYFMLGLPTEDQADVQALVDLALACAARAHAHRSGTSVTQVGVNVTPFVPKAHTPFQRMAQTPAKVVRHRVAYVERELRRRGVGVKSESPAWAEIQGTLARGDRRLAEAILSVDHVTPAIWRQTLIKVDLSDRDLLRQRADNEALPWSFIQSGRRPSPKS